jgi:ABC-type amino acid transport system permease subunit
MDRSLFLARITRITLSVIVALSIASAAYAQEALKGGRQGI